MNRPEILAPAGSYKAMEAAIKAGADAVYMGGSLFGARAYAENPEEKELIDAIHYTHFYNKKLYLTLNTLLKETEMSLIGDYLRPYYEAGLDGIIIQDPGVFSFIKKNFPGLELHVSTQMNVTGTASAKLLKEMGASRIVPARELSLEEITEIKKETGLEIETFVHGALCYCYSGRCLMSSMLGGRSGNRGRCAQPCRLPYEISKKKGASCLLSPKDMCAVNLIPELIRAGIDSFKIEGRMKNPEYVAVITSVYRKYVDLFLAHPEKPFKVEEEDWQLLLEAYNRGGFTEGYYHSRSGPDMMSMDRPNHRGLEAGTVEKIKGAQIFFHPEIEIHKGDILEIEVPKGENIVLTSPEDCRKGKNLALNGRKIAMIRPGMTILRTGNPWLKEKLAEKILDPDKKIRVNGYVEVMKDQPVRLSLWTDPGDGTEGTDLYLEGDMVSEAQGRPMSPEQIKKPLMQTGGTGFEFKELTAEVDDQVFVSMGSLKKLRREALEALEEKIKGRSDRKMERTPVYEHQPGPRTEKTEEPEIRVSIEDKGQFRTVLKLQGADSICLPLEELSKEERRSFAAEAIDHKKDVYYTFPRVFRNKEQEYYEKIWEELSEEDQKGYEIHNIDEFAWILNKDLKGKKLILSHSLYAYNQEAVQVYRELLKGVSSVCHVLPVELNKKELSMVNYGENELFVYGRIPLMVTAQCVTKNTTGCIGRPGYTTMTDRYHKNFYVRRHCKHCYNTIWNGVPVSLHGLRSELEPLNPSSLRIHFTTEGEEEMKAVLDTFRYEWKEKKEHPEINRDYTRGHLKRGIE